MTTDTIPARVARGVALLDKTLADWDERIDLDKLDLTSPYNCILGQEFANHPDVVDGYYSGFDIGYDALTDGDPLFETLHGFTARRGSGADVFAEFVALAAEWTRVILARREVRDDR